ncbi:MAG: tetratricopeptide repeat protein [Saccharospirillum sp.]
MNPLYHILIEHGPLTAEQLDPLVAELKDPEDGRALGALVIRDGLMSFGDVMDLALTHGLFVKAAEVLRRLQQARKGRTVIKPQQHSARYRIAEDATEQTTLTLTEGLTLDIIEPDLDAYQNINTDERQVVEMAMELVRIRQFQEAEMFLIDARSEFQASARVPLVLSWLYLRCGLPREARAVSLQAVRDFPSDIQIVEQMGLIEQCLGKHLLAVNQFQKLVLLPRVKPIWYLLLGLSLERARLRTDAVSNYRIFLGVSRQAELTAFAEQRLAELAD